MADDIIKIKIEADMDFGNAQEQLKAAGKEIRGMKEEMADMPNVSRIFNNSIEKTASIVDSVSGKLEALSSGRVADPEKKESFINRANEAIKDANVMHGLQVGSSTYGVQIAREWFKGLPQAVQKEFDAITPTITSIIRSRMSSISRDGLHFKGASPEALAVEALDDNKIKGLIDRNVKLADQKQVEGYLKRLIPNIVAQNRLNQYQEARYGSVVSNAKDAMIRNKPHTYLPESYQSSFLDAQAYRRNVIPEKDARKVLSQEAFQNLQYAFEKHPIAVKAALESGIARRDKRGVLETKRDLTREEWEGMREALYGEMVNRATGAGSKRIDIYGTDEKNQSTLAKRFTSTSAGKAILAMFATEGMMSPDAWVDKDQESGYVKQAKEAKRILDSYSVLKYNPFLKQRGGSFNGDPFDKTNAQFAMIQESQNTQLLGKGKWKHNQDISDTVALISLAGYDPNNKDQFEAVRDIFAHGKTINGIPMVAQSTHGNGNDTVIRMIAKSAYDAVEKEEGEWARQNGFSGSYFQNFTDKQITEMAAADAKFGTKNLTAKILGKKYDAENKGWSPSADMGLNLNGKKFAIVDVDKEGDGSAWLASSVMPYSNQSRFAVAGKGSTFVFKGNTMRDYAKRAGFLDDQGRWMMKGLNGEMFDVSGYNGIIPADVVKNTLAYGHVDPETGKFVYGKSYINDKGQRIIDTSNEALSEMVTSAIQRYGFRAISNYENENEHSNSIGSQMTSFMKLSPEMRKNQAEAYAKVMRELDTEEGQLRYVFTNQDTDWLSKQVHANPQLLQTATARKRVDDFRASLQQDMASGQYLDLGQDDSLISQARLADNLLRVGLETTQDPQVRANVLEKAKSAMLKAHKREYTDEEILDLINLNKNAEGEHRVIDFQHMNEKHVGLLRSPTGYGNMAYAENIAAEIAPLFDAFGQEKVGAFVSKEVLDILQSADYDGDRVKIVTGYLADAVKKTEAEVRERKKLFQNINSNVETNEAAYKEALTDDAAQRAHAAGRNVEEPLHMGFASAGIRGMQVDSSNPLNNRYLAAQEYLQKMYDITSVGHKDPQIVDMTKIPQNVWDVNKLGREFTKFTEHAQDIFQYDPDQLDQYGNPLEKGPDLFKTATGKMVNMRRLKDLQIDQTNLPSTHMDAHMMGLAATRRTFLEGSSDLSTWNAISEALEQLEMPKNATENVKNLLSTMRKMFPQFGSGERGLISEEEASDIRTRIGLVKRDIDKEAEAAKRLGGVYEETGENGELKQYKSLEAFIDAKEKEYGVLTARNAVDIFGVTESRVARKHGQAEANALGKNGTVEMMDQIINDAIHDHAEQVAEQATEEVKQEAEEIKSSTKGKSKKPRAKRTTKPKEKIIDEELDKKIAEQIQNIQEDPSKTIQETYGKLLSDFAGVEATKALAMKMYEDNNRTIQGQRKVIGANRDLTDAQQFFRIESGKRSRAHESYDFLIAQGNQKALEQAATELGINPGSGTQLIKNAIAQQVDMIDRGFIGETRQWSTDKTQQSLDFIKQSVEGTDQFKAEAKQVDSWTEAIRQAQSALDEFLQSRDKLSKEGAFSEEDIKKDAEAQDKMLKNIQEAQNLQIKGIQQTQQKNSEYFTNMTSGLYDQMYGKTASPLERVDLTVAGYKQSIANGLTKLEQAHNAGPNVITEEAYLRELENFKNLEKYAEGSLRSDMYNRIFSDYGRRTSRMELQSDRMARQRTMRLSMGGAARFAMQNENEYQQREILQDQMQAQLDQLIQARDGRLNAETGKRTGGITDKAAYDRATEEINKLSAAMANNQKQMEGLKGPSGVLNATFSSMAMSVQRLAMRFGRQLFQKALVEAKKFVLDYNRTMTEIQMITLKTDDQMSVLGDGLVSKAKDLKISINEISKSAATLYRQGLSDEEVDERLGVISKFSKVSGTKIDAATKLITVAMNTGLVSDPQIAADIVTALGDNAATNAAEIERGIEKAGAAASADGTTFAQLASMLTAITSTTQIGGSTAGRTLNTIFGRMNKIGTNELIYDENGNAVSGSAVAKLLEKQGISQYDNGVKKSSYETLYELSQKWDKMSDAEQQQIATAIAGTRQYSNFSAIMQGMAEGKVDQYMSLAGESAGITDKKYEIYVKSLDASLTNLKNTFDELVKDLTSNGVITGVVDTLSSMVQGVNNLTKSITPLGAVLTTVLPLLAGLTALKMGMLSGSVPTMAAGLGLVAAGGIIANIAGNAGPSAAERNQEYDENYRTRIAEYEGLDRLKELRSNPNRTDAENEEYASLINKFAQNLGLTNDAAGSAAYSVETLSGAIKRLSEGADDAADKVIKEADEQKEREFAANIANTRGDTIDELESGAKEKRAELDKTLSLGNRWFNGKVWDYDAATGEYKLKENALKNQQSWVQTGLGNDSLFGLQGIVSGWVGGNTVSYNKNLEDPLVDFYYNASKAGKMGQSEMLTSREQWSNRLKAGVVTQEQLEAAFEYMNRSSPVNDTDFESKRIQAKEILSRKLSAFYNEGQIDYLANKMAQNWHTNGNAANAYNSIVGTGSTYKEMIEAVNGNLSGYVPEGTVRKMPYNLQDVGTNGYYIDETGKQWTASEVQAYYDSQNASNRKNAIAIMQEYVSRIEAENAARTAAYESDVTAEARRMYRWNDSLYSHHGEEGYVGGRPAAERAYYEDLWMQEALKSYSPELAKSIWEGKDENLKNRAISSIAWDHPFIGLSPEEQDKYLSQYGDMWDELSPEKQAEWIAKAKEAIALPDLLDIPGLDKDQLVDGAEATAEALGKLYDQGKVLPEVADKINAANEKSAQGQHQFEAVVNHFLDAASAAYESEQGFGTKNKAAISADNLVGLLLSGRFGTGAAGAAAFMSYLNENTEAESDWLTLVQNSPDLQNVVSQIYRNQKTGQIIAPDDIMSQLLHTIQGSSLTYGASYLSPAERGAIAQQAYSGLTNEGWFISQQSKNAAQEAAWLEYQENVLNTYNARKAEIEASEAPNEVKRAELASLKKEARFTTKEAFVLSHNDLMNGAMSAEQASYLKAVLGDQMYSRVLEASTPGGKALTQAEKDYAALVLGNNANGLTSLTSAQQLKGMKDVRAAIRNGTFERDAAADQYMSQWSDWSEYAALLSKRQAGNLSPEDTRRMNVLETSLNNLERSAQIKLDIEGVKQLEEAGEVAEGTAARIEKLRSGGKVKVDVEMQIHNEAFESGQRRAKLFNGNTAEQDEAAMALLSMAREEYFGNRDANLAKAQQIDRETYQGIDANTWTRLYRSAKTVEDRQIILDAAAKAGFVPSKDSAKQTFEYTGTDIANINPLAGIDRVYSETERNSMLDRILAGETREAGKGGNSNLFDAALEIAGENTKELLRRWANSETDLNYADWIKSADVPEWLKSAARSERSSYHQSRYGSLFSARSQEALARQGLTGDILNEENASAIASYLNMDESRVRQMMRGSRIGELETLINEKANSAIDAVKSELTSEIPDISLTATNWDELIAEIEAAAEQADGEVKNLLLNYRDALLDGAKVLTPDEAIEKYSSWFKTQRDAASITDLQNRITSGTSYDDLMKNIIGENGVFSAESDFGSFLSRNSAIADVFARARESGNFTPEIMNSLMQISPEAVLNRDQNYQQQYAKWNNLMDSSGGIDIEKLTSLVDTDSVFNEWLSQFENLPDLLADSSGMANGTSKAFKNLHAEMYAGLLKSLRPWGDATDEIVENGKAATKSLRGQADAAKKLRTSIRDIQDNQASRSKIRTGKKVDSEAKNYLESLGFDKKDLKDPSKKEQIEEAFRQEEEAEKEELSEQYASAMFDLGEELTSMSKDKRIEVLGPEVVVDEGSITMNNSEMLAKFGAIMTEEQRKYIEEAISKGVEIEWQISQQDNTVSIKPVVKAVGGSGGHRSSSKGSGGGGGKSKTDKLIEETENRVMEAKHKITMAEAKQEHFAFTNQYQNEINAIYEEVSAQKGLAEVYQENLVSLKAQQDAVKKYSEDWWKLEKQILSTQEALAEVNNTIEALSKKQVEVVQRKQDNEDAPYRQKRTMIDSYVERFQTQYQSGGRYTEAKAYKAWEKYQLNQVNSIQQQIDQNKKQMSEWQALLGTLDKNTQTYKDVQQKIWDIQKENAELENELLQKEIDLNNARLERIAKVLQNNMGGSEHEINMSDTRSQIYQITRDYAAYRTELAKQKSQYGNEATYYATALEQAKQQMNSLVQGSAAWYQARDAVYQYEEALQQLELTQEELDQALRESYLTELYEKIDKVDTKNQQRLTAAQNMSQRAKLVGDDEAYISGLEKEEKALIKQTETEQKNLALLMELKNSGKIKKGTKEWDDLLQKIKDVENQMNQTANSVLEKANEIAQARLEKIMGDYEDSIRDVEHSFNMIQYQEANYKNNGELTNYGEALKAERDNRQKLLLEQRNTRTRLLEELNRYEVGTQQYENVLEQIQKIEEEIAKTENAVDNVTKAIKENEEAIRKVKMNIENTLNNEMKKRVQEEKDQLSATVNLQKSILDTIKKRYQDEWRLIKQDLEKKKKALQEEKSLIQERVRARKDAEQTEDKQNQLTELQKQLAIIEADPTRTKEAKELRKQIEDLQKEISDNLADNIASAEQKRLDDIINGITDYVTNHEQDLNEYLADNTNFQEILDRVLSGAEEDYADYMRENDETYKNATAEQKRLMEQGWHDTWLKMRGDVENYWNEVLRYTEINEENQSQIRDEFIDYMKQGSDYTNASETRQMSLVYEWTKMFDDYVSSMKVDENAGRPETTDTGEGGSNPATGKEIKDLLEDLKNSTLKTSIDGPVTLNENYMAALAAIANSITGTNRYSKGGLVSYTGLARVDGTPGHPESFLDAVDTANVRMMLDQLNYIKKLPTISHVPDGSFVNSETSIGDVYVTINEAEINGDQDIDELAKKVGQSFVKQLSRSGFNTANYAF